MKIPKILLFLASILISFVPMGAAQALTIENSTLTTGTICEVPGVFECNPFVAPFEQDVAAAITSGTIDITGSTLTFAFSADGPVTFLGSDGPLTSVVFSDLVYSGTGAVTVEPNGQFSFLDQTIDITGTFTTGAGPAVGFSISDANLTGSCDGNPGQSLICGFNVGPAGTGFDLAGNERFLFQQINIVAIPEPGAAMLIGLGLAGFASRRRSNT